jgi:hypothetical protein
MERDVEAEERDRTLRLSELVANPAFFFDMRYLQERVTAIAGWSQERLEVALGPRFERVLSSADLRIPAAAGSYVVFASPNRAQARETADAICKDIMTHFFGAGGYTAEDAEKLCRPMSVQTITSERTSSAAFQSGAPGQQKKAQETPGPEEEKSFVRELIEIYRASLANDGTQGFGFAPLWDSKHERVMRFACELMQPMTDTADATYSDISAAMGHCKVDVAGLASATKGIRHIQGRGEIAAICITVHVSTLTWAKTRNAYLAVLAQIEPGMRSFMAPRMIGVDPGFNLSTISGWSKTLGQFTPWSFLHLPSLAFDFRRLGLLGVRGIGVSARVFFDPQSNTSSVARQTARLTSLCENQKALGYVDKVGSAQELQALKDHGIRGIAGSIIGTPAEMPGPTGSLPLSEIVSR